MTTLKGLLEQLRALDLSADYSTCDLEKPHAVLAFLQAIKQFHDIKNQKSSGADELVDFFNKEMKEHGSAITSADLEKIRKIALLIENKKIVIKEKVFIEEQKYKREKNGDLVSTSKNIETIFSGKDTPIFAVLLSFQVALEKHVAENLPAVLAKSPSYSISGRKLTDLENDEKSQFKTALANQDEPGEGWLFYTCREVSKDPRILGLNSGIAIPELNVFEVDDKAKEASINKLKKIINSLTTNETVANRFANRLNMSAFLSRDKQCIQDMAGEEKFFTTEGLHYETTIGNKGELYHRAIMGYSEKNFTNSSNNPVIFYTDTIVKIEQESETIVSSQIVPCDEAAYRLLGLDKSQVKVQKPITIPVDKNKTAAAQKNCQAVCKKIIDQDKAEAAIPEAMARAEAATAKAMVEAQEATAKAMARIEAETVKAMTEATAATAKAMARAEVAITEAVLKVSPEQQMPTANQTLDEDKSKVETESTTNLKARLEITSEQQAQLIKAITGKTDKIEHESFLAKDYAKVSGNLFKSIRGKLINEQDGALAKLDGHAVNHANKKTRLESYISTIKDAKNLDELYKAIENNESKVHDNTAKLGLYRFFHRGESTTHTLALELNDELNHIVKTEKTEKAELAEPKAKTSRSPLSWLKTKLAATPEPTTATPTMSA